MECQSVVCRWPTLVNSATEFEIGEGTPADMYVDGAKDRDATDAPSIRQTGIALHRERPSYCGEVREAVQPSQPLVAGNGEAAADVLERIQSCQICDRGVRNDQERARDVGDMEKRLKSWRASVGHKQVAFDVRATQLYYTSEQGLIADDGRRHFRSDPIIVLNRYHGVRLSFTQSRRRSTRPLREAKDGRSVV